MATIIKRQRVRQGLFIDLPDLASGEFGYATDQNRLFIGNDDIVRDQSDGVSNGSYIDYNFGVDLDNKEGAFKVFVVTDYDLETENRVLLQSAEYEIDNLLVKIKSGSHPEPNTKVVLVYNSEVGVIGADQDRPVEFKETMLSGTGTLAQISIDQERSDSYIINYSIRNDDDSHIRNGTLKVFAVGEMVTISDDYTQNVYPSDDLDREFFITTNGNVSLLNFTPNVSGKTTHITWVVERFKSNVSS